MILELIISPVANIRRHARHVKYGNSSSGTDRAPGVRALFHLLQISAFLDRCFHGHVHKKIRAYLHTRLYIPIFSPSLRSLFICPVKPVEKNWFLPAWGHDHFTQEEELQISGLRSSKKKLTSLLSPWKIK